MARFDPDTYPDRLAFEANARRIRSEELARIFAAAAGWLQRRAQRLARHAAPARGGSAARSPSESPV